MELAKPKTRKVKERRKEPRIHEVDLFYGSEEELEYPETGEFQDIFDFLRLDDLEKEACDEGVKYNAAIRTGICLSTSGEEHEVHVKAFVCKVCGKSFESENSCKKHVSRSHPSNLEPRQENLNRSIMNGYGLSFEPEYTPVRLGKWSKVICEFRHRYCQEEENDYHSSSTSSTGLKFIDDEQTRPKASTEEQNYARVVKKLGECLQTKSSPYRPPSLMGVEELLEKTTPHDNVADETANDSGVHSPRASPLGASVNLIDLEAIGGSKKACRVDTITADMESRRLKCGACNSFFETFDEADLHLAKNDEESSSLLPDSAGQCLLYSKPRGISTDSSAKDSPALLRSSSDDYPQNDTEKCSDANEPGETDDGAADPGLPSENSPMGDHNGGFMEEYATLDVKDAPANGRASLGDSDLEIFKEKNESFFMNDVEKKPRKNKIRKKKKKNKPWRLMKRAFFLTLGALF